MSIPKTSILKGWRRGDLAVYLGGIDNIDLTEGDTYVVNHARAVRDVVYLQVIADDRNVVDLLSTHFKKVARNKRT